MNRFVDFKRARITINYLVCRPTTAHAMGWPWHWFHSRHWCVRQEYLRFSKHLIYQLFQCVGEARADLLWSILFTSRVRSFVSLSGIPN